MAQVSYGTITITDTNDIERIYTVYAKSNTNTDVPTAAASNWKESISEAPGSGNYIWQRTVVQKSGTLEKTYSDPVCLTGEEGTDGRGIVSITIKYGTSADWNTQPSNWYDNTPEYNSGTPNYWTQTTINYTTGNPTVKVTQDKALTQAVYNSAMANSIAQSANENANGAMSQVVEVEQHLSVTDTNVSALQTRLKKIWINEVTSGDYVAGTYAASGIEGITFVENNPSTFGYNTLLRHNQLALRYNTINMTQLSTAALTFYRPTTINNQLVQGDRGLVINADELDILSISNYKLTDDTTVDPTKIYYSKNNNVYTRISTPSGNPHTNNYYEHDIDAKLDANGLILKKGGIKAGTAEQSGFIYLSTEPYGSYSINDSSGISDWKEIIGTKFGVRADGTLYANNAVIKGNITATSLTIDSGATVSGLSTSNISGISDYATKINAQNYANDASYLVEVEARNISYTTPTATLFAHVYYKGAELTASTTPAISTISFQWQKVVESSGVYSVTNINGATSQSLTTSDLDTIYICVISKP